MTQSPLRNGIVLRTQSLALALLAIHAGFVLAQSRAATDTITREEKWRTDLRFLATELPKRHLNL